MKKFLFVLLSIMLTFTLVGCQSNNSAQTTSEPSTAPTAETVTSNNVKFGVTIGTSDGTNMYALAGVAVDETGKILAARIEEFTFMDATDTTGVPNADGDFAEGFANAQEILVSKRVNDATYTDNMKNYAGATMTLVEGYNAIEAYVVGKTAGELLTESEKGAEAVDAVSGSTLTGTWAYLKLIAEGAQVAEASGKTYTVNSLSDLKVSEAEYATHGTKCFATPFVLLEGDKIIAAYIDEFQFFSSDAGVTPVPNTDGDFGAKVAEGQVLGSKRLNNTYYSSLMTEHAGATQELATSYEAIENYVAGKTISELKAVVDGQDSETFVDTVSGSTLVDTLGYVQAIIKAAETE